jgi:hypothetical protein
VARPATGRSSGWLTAAGASLPCSGIAVEFAVAEYVPPASLLSTNARGGGQLGRNGFVHGRINQMATDILLRRRS